MNLLHKNKKYKIKCIKNLNKQNIKNKYQQMHTLNEYTKSEITFLKNKIKIIQV